MNNRYCFNCQKEVKSKNILGLHFCPFCGKRITDSGEGFYLICDNCGANNPTDAGKCVKCGKHLNTLVNTDNEEYFNKRTFLNLIFDFLLVLSGIAISVLVLYISFYLVFAFFALGIIYFLFSKIRIKL